MKNQLIPLTACPNSQDEYQPALISHGYKYRSLERVKTGGYRTRHDHQGFSFRRDLKGLVHRCDGLPIIEIDDGGLFAVRNADTSLVTDLSGNGWK
jgi:hypothetical protein